MDFDMPDAGGIDLNFDMGAFDVDFSTEPKIANDRYQRPVAEKAKKAAFDNAMELARSIDLHKGFRAFCVSSGNFIFADFLEAMTRLDKWRVDHMTIHTLTMSQEAIDSLQNLIIMDQPSSLHIIMSDYWYVHECGRPNGLLWELYDKCDIGDGFRLAFCRTHAKVITVRTKKGNKIVIHGSANMRSHGVIEQFMIENDDGLYDFIEQWNDGILDRYDTINHNVKRKKPVREKALYEIAKRGERL